MSLFWRAVRQIVVGKTRALLVVVSIASVAILTLANSQAFADDLVVVTPEATPTIQGSLNHEDYPGPGATQYPVTTQVVHEGSVTIDLSYYGINLTSKSPTPHANYPSYPGQSSYPTYPTYPGPAQNFLSRIVLVALDNHGTPIIHLSHPLTITFDYSQFDMSSFNPNLLRIYWTEDGVDWTPLDTHVDLQNHLAWAVVYHLSTYALAAPHAQTLAPLVFIPAVMHMSSNGW
ncbi:MAG TPA: hypothetical protein VNG11_01470 [Chloroflexota bacterium]|nr:hypothetical protein [Chloroflexota bacterium]